MAKKAKKPAAKKPANVLSSPIFGEPAFNEQIATPDPTGLAIVPNDSGEYKDPQVKKLLDSQVVGFDKMRGDSSSLYSLASALGTNGAAEVQAITDNEQIVFHIAGDTGASNDKKYQGELHVSDQMAIDCRAKNASDRPAFFYNLGDLVYDFGQSNYYFEQFYEPYRNYPAPIFAIPGNHDSFVLPGTPANKTPLTTFSRNFCATSSAPTPEAGSLHRTAMRQPGVYFTLDAPFVRIIGLFSNALEDPGLISSETIAGKGKKKATKKWKAVPDYQLDYLEAQLTSIKNSAYAGAVILAMHHPPFSYALKKSEPSGNHGGSPVMLAEIDQICTKVGVYPHAVVSGHAHNYQRYTRTFDFGGKPYAVPFLVCGNGGHNVNPLYRAPRGKRPPIPNGDPTSPTWTPGWRSNRKA